MFKTLRMIPFFCNYLTGLALSPFSPQHVHYTSNATFPGITANRFTGEATEGFLNQAAQANPNIAMNLSESEALRNKIRANMQRDAAYSDFPQDVQNTRQFLSEADWARAVQMIRQGVKPAAALAAMGYSLNSMADQNQVSANPFYTDPFGNTIPDTTR